MKRFSLFILFVSSIIMVYSQRTAKVSATYTYYAPETMSVEEAKRIALERAKIQAIADEFGTIVSQSTSTVISNKNGETDTQFFSLGGSDVKGEWLETIGNPEFGDIYYKDNILVIPCTVRGKAREVSLKRIDFISKPLKNGCDLRFQSYEFKDGDDFYLYFRSPIAGFLTVFLVDDGTQTAYCVLPYRESNGVPKQVEADKEYILFSRDHCTPEEKELLDEYVMTSERSLEHNELYVLFSPHAFTKPSMHKGNEELSPKTMELHDFQKWLVNARAKNPDLSLSKIIITVSKNLK